MQQQDTSISEFTGQEVLPLQDPVYNAARKDSAQNSVRGTPRPGHDSDRAGVERFLLSLADTVNQHALIINKLQKRQRQRVHRREVMMAWKTLTDALSEPQRTEFFQTRRYVKPEAEFIARREAGAVAERVEIPHQIKQMRKKSSALMSRTSLLGRGSMQQMVEVSDDEYEKTGEDKKSLRSVQDGALIMSMAVTHVNRVVEEIREKQEKQNEKMKKINVQLEEVKRLKQTDYTSFIDKVQSELFALSEKVVALESENRTLERELAKKFNRAMEEINTQQSSFSTKVHDVQRLLESRVKQEYVDSGLKSLNDKFIRKIEREVEQVDKKAQNGLKNNMDRLRKMVAGCETKTGQLMLANDKMKIQIHQIDEKVSKSVQKVEREVIDRLQKFKIIINGKVDEIRAAQEETFRRLAADKKRLNEAFNKAVDRIDGMVERLKGDHDLLYEVSGKADKLCKDLNLLCDGLEKFEARVEERYAILGREINSRPTPEKIIDILKSLEEFKNAQNVDKKLEDLIINIDEATRRVDCKIDVFKQEMNFNSIATGFRRKADKTDVAQLGSTHQRRLGDVERIASRNTEGFQSLENFVENLAIAVKNLQKQAKFKNPQKMLLNSDGKCMSCGIMTGDHSPHGMYGLSFTTPKGEPLQQSTRNYIKTEQSLSNSISGIAKTPISGISRLQQPQTPKELKMQQSRKSFDNMFMSARKQTPRPHSQNARAKEAKQDEMVVYKSSGKFTGSFTEASQLKKRQPKFFNFALYVSSKKRPKSSIRMSELEYSQRQGPNNIFYQRAQSRKDTKPPSSFL